MVILEQFGMPLFSFTLFIFFLRKWLSGNPQKNVPPSPRKLPIIGNLHQLSTSPHRSLQALSNIYGPLILLHLGRVPVLVASSADAAREILKDQDAIFSNRPKLSIPDKLSYGSRDVAFAPYGEYWRQMRSICVLHLLSNKRVQSYDHVRQEMTSDMIEKVRRLGSSLGVVNLTEVLLSLTNGMVCRMALGRKYENDKKFIELLSQYSGFLGGTDFFDYIPWLGWVMNRVNNLNARVESAFNQFDEFLENVIREHKDANREGDGEMDFVDILLQFQKDNKMVSPVEDDTIKALIMDMFAAGTDTSALTVDWALAELMKNPRTIRILENEVRRVAGTKKEIEVGDIQKMSYLKAVIKETLRLHAPVPLLYHESTQDTRVMGYDVSAGTLALINAWAIGRDPSLWENPEEFYPERFLDSTIDFKGQHFELIPFGAGRRGCPGIASGLAVVELTIAKLLHNFNFALPNGERVEDMDMSESSGLSLRRKLPLLVTTT